MTSMNHSRFRLSIFAFVLVGLSALLLPALSARQDEEDATRRLWNKQFEQARAKANKPAPASSAHNRPAPKAQTAPPAPLATTSESKPVAVSSAPEVPDNDLIGITLWRLREASKSERSLEERLLVQQTFIAERVESAAKFAPGQRVRLSVEIPRAGENFLYVIDRELYANGATSAPYLIFPSLTVNGGKNIITAGRIADIPTLSDQTPYFTLASNRADYAGEQLTFIISPTRLPELPTSTGAPQPLNDEQTDFLQNLEQGWDKTAERRDAKGKPGVKWTVAERNASAGERLLVQGDPLPQVIYRVPTRDGVLVIIVPLPVAR